MSKIVGGVPYAKPVETSAWKLNAKRRTDLTVKGKTRMNQIAQIAKLRESESNISINKAANLVGLHSSTARNYFSPKRKAALNTTPASLKVQKKKPLIENIKKLLGDNPDIKSSEVAQKLGLRLSTAARYLTQYKKPDQPDKPYKRALHYPRKSFTQKEKIEFANWAIGKTPSEVNNRAEQIGAGRTTVYRWRTLIPEYA